MKPKRKSTPIIRMRRTEGQVAVIILAAGEGARMESQTPKILHPIVGLPMVLHVLRTANALKPSGIALVVGHEAGQVTKEVNQLSHDLGILRPVTFIKQKAPSGTGQAVWEASHFIKKFDTVMILCGDSPLVRFETLYSMLEFHRETKCQMTVLTGRLSNPTGYGRIQRTPPGEVQKITEESQAGPKELAINEVNSGVYCIETGPLLEAVKHIIPKGLKNEQYLTDVVEIIRAAGGRVLPFTSLSPEEILGVNSRVQMAQVERIANRRILERFMLAGVTVVDPLQVYLDIHVDIGPDSIIFPGTILRGKTHIGPNCRIGPYAMIVDSQIGRDCEVLFSCISQSRILEKSTIGPFSHLRPDSVIGPRAKVGNFTEIKSSHIGFGSKVPHLSYIGDAKIAEDVNIGAGTITCNYDGTAKHKTFIGQKTFVGSNVNFIAPVKIGKGSKIGAGSTITEDVPDGALAIARARQVTKQPKK